MLVSNASAVSFATATKQANIGDSISQGFGANSVPGDQVHLSWVRGDDARVQSMYSRYSAATPGFEQEPVSVSGAELVGGDDSLPAQASRVCAQSPRPTRVAVLLGGNDVCNRPRSSSDDAAANMYSVTTWVSALRAGLDQLADCLAPGSVVQVLSAPRVDFLYEAGNAKSLWCSWGIWPIAGVCRIVTGESDPGRRAQIGDRIDAYNAATHAEVRAYASNANGKNGRGVAFVSDWEGSIAQGNANTSVGTFHFTENDINGVDCFHPNVEGQARIACLAWSKGADGHGNASSCF